MIQVRDIYKSFGILHVLKGVGFDIAKGEIVALVGASGAGKTTLLHITGTLDKADKGKIMIDGQDISALKKKYYSGFRNKKIGFVFQFHYLLPEFTALENICIPGFIGKRPKAEVEAEAMELASFLGIQERMNHKPSELSGGEQQRVAVARALINRPSVILADEPSGNLDSQNANDLHRLFFSLRDKFNHTFLIATHNERLAAMSDRKLVIKDGVISPS